MKLTKSFPIVLMALVAVTAGAANAANASGKNWHCDDQKSARKGASHYGHSAQSGMHLLFKQIDTDGDGKISKKEMDKFRSSNIDTADLNKDGALSIAEFEPVYNELTRTRMVRAFQSLDTNGDGKISKEELDTRFDLLVKHSEQKASRNSK